jgi:hypothetical protein
MSRILVAFDYWGANYPLVNNQNFNRPFSELDCDSGNYEFFDRVGGYECVPSVILKEYDNFIYPISLGLSLDRWPWNPDLDILSSTSMSVHTLNGICGRHGFLFLDLGHEALLNDTIFDTIHSYLFSKNIPLRKVIFQIGNSNGKKIYKDYCFRKGVTFEKAMNISCLEYFEWQTSRNYDMQVNRLKVIPLPKNLNYNAIQKTFLCLNNRQRSHRTNLFVLFTVNDLLKDSFYTMNDNSGFEQNDPKTYRMADTISRNLMARYGLTVEDINKMEKILPLKLEVDTATDLDSMTELFGTVDTYYQSSLISVVTETNFETPDVFNTEKIFKPMIHRHPFILVGPYKTLEKLKELGYKTFSDFWDESYDDIEDPDERLLKIVEVCKSISEWGDGDKKKFFYKSMSITTHNYNLITTFYPNNMRDNFWHRLNRYLDTNKII